MNKDKDICEKLGIPYLVPIVDLHTGVTLMNPAYYFSTDAGAVQLLRLIMKKGDWEEFAGFVQSYKWFDFDDCMELVITPGKLRDVAWEWLCGGEKLSIYERKGVMM